MPAPADKKRMRHPLRNEWDAHKAAFAEAAKGTDKNAAIARAMIAIAPEFIALLEQERDAGTPGDHMLAAGAAVAGMVIENIIEHRKVMITPGSALNGMLAHIARVVGPRVAGRAKEPRIILPGRE